MNNKARGGFMTLTWNDLFAEGTLVDFSTHLWRARIRLKAEDLGIDATDDVQKALSFGCHRLAPASAFKDINSIVNQWQSEIEQHSLVFPLLEGVRYVPDSQVDELQTKLARHKRTFDLAVNEFLENYEEMAQEQLPIIEQALQDAAKTPEAAAQAYSRVVSEYPSREKVAEKFGLEWNFFTIQIPASKAAAKTAKAAAPQISKVVNGMIEQLRKELAEKVENLLTLAKGQQEGTSRQKSGFAKKSRESALAVLAKVDRLNFLNDSVLKEQTRILRDLLDSDISEIDSVMRDLSAAKVALESDLQEAAKNAEKRLTGLGTRKIQS
jgi:hypothetical protein